MLGELAFIFVAELHRYQKRKGSQVPYLSHLLAVTSLVMEDGGSEKSVLRVFGLNQSNRGLKESPFSAFYGVPST